MFPAEHRLHRVDFAPLTTVLAATMEAVAQTLGGRAAEKVVDTMLRRHRGWTPEERACAVEAVYAVAVWRRRLAHHAGSEDPRLLVFALLRDLVGMEVDRARALCDVVDVPVGRVAPPDAATRWSFPPWMMALFERELGAEAEAFAQALNVPGPICFRVNTLKTTRAALQELLVAHDVVTEPTRWASDGLRVTGARPNILGLPAHQQGLFEVQDEGSQLLGALVAAQPGETVVDWCAGAGGKTLQLAANMQNQGRLFFHDVDQERLQRLRLRAYRAGVTIASPLEGGQADAVLVDAPCSELGALRRGPDLRFRITEAELDAFPPLQRRILDDAAQLVRAGGRLVYATCTIYRAENMDVVTAFLQGHPEFMLVAPPLDPSLVRAETFVCLPHRHGTDGFFAAVMRRR